MTPRPRARVPVASNPTAARVLCRTDQHTRGGTMMDLTVDQAALGHALRLVARVASPRPTLPILQTVLLAGEPGHLRLTVTDAELALTTMIAADVAIEGRAAIPARLLGEYVGHLPASPLRLVSDSDRSRLRATCGPFVANLASADP